LIVDDNALLRRVVEEALASMGYVTLTAASGAEALTLSERDTEIDLLVTDIMMPGMRGTELAPKLLAARPQLRVLYMSAQRPQPDWGLEEIEAVSDFIAKPFGLPALASRVREILDR
jgi:CheY-like chemotaxis protein